MKRRFELLTIALALLVATAAGASASQPSSAESGARLAATCRDYIVIDSRGSGEPRGLSAPGKVFYPAFRAEVLRRNPKATMTFIANGYSAWGSIPTMISALLKLPQRYHESVKEGKVWLSNVIGALLANSTCPDTKLILTGYSQGAQVTGDVYQNTSSKRILGVVLFGDPKFNSADPAARGGKSGLDGALGTRPLYGLEPGKLSAGRVLSYCHDRDPVCQGVSRLRYGPTYHEDYGARGEPEEAARYVARLAAPGGASTPQVTAGAAHTCALIAGGVKCWGSNDRGQLGDGTTSDRLTPVSVSGLSSGVAAIDAGYKHTCALLRTGGVKCWGGNFSGQLGDDTLVNRSRPVRVSGLSSGVRAISAGDEHTCALISGGGLRCWGEGGNGQLARVINPDRPVVTPVASQNLPGRIAAVSAGGYHTCGISSAGGAWCWGNNAYGELGDGVPGSKSTPATVNGLSSGVAAISANVFRTCALLRGGEVKCWGAVYGAAGPPRATKSYPTPIGVRGLSSGVVAISAGGGHTCGILRMGGARCWGRNSSGQLGDGTTTTRMTAVEVTGLSSDVVAISAGGNHTCALLATSAVKCWGGNYGGQLGNGTRTDSSTPVVVRGL